MTKAVNYTTEQETAATSMYQDGATMEAIATALGKSVRSVVAKLSNLGVYKAKARGASDVRVTKADLVATIEGRYAVEAGTFADMEKLTKATLLALARED
jgi:hypothetical protein